MFGIKQSKPIRHIIYSINGHNTFMTVITDSGTCTLRLEVFNYFQGNKCSA